MFNIFGNKYKIYQVLNGKNSMYEIYKRIFFGIYECVGLFTYKEARKYMKEHNIKIEIITNEAINC